MILDVVNAPRLVCVRPPRRCASLRLAGPPPELIAGAISLIVELTFTNVGQNTIQ